jgi:hypothetical protein
LKNSIAGSPLHFGIPGDFIPNLYEALEKLGKFLLLSFSHEPAVGFAADVSAQTELIRFVQTDWEVRKAFIISSSLLYHL